MSDADASEIRVDYLLKTCIYGADETIEDT